MNMHSSPHRLHDPGFLRTPTETPTQMPAVKTAGWRGRLRAGWFRLSLLASGLAALAWLLLRSGTKPSRLTYPCQQAAISTASLTLGGTLVAVLLAVRQRLIRILRSPAGIAVASFGLFILGSWGYLTHVKAEPPLRSAPLDYRAQLYHVTDCPQDPVGEHFVGLDNLLTLMGREGLKLYRSPNESLLAGPNGIIATDDVVIIKINYQWPERGGTNTDLLRGLIRRLLDHPDGFAGQIVVCENAQFNSVENFDRADNNAQDHSLSPHDVVLGFQSQGAPVSHYDWTAIHYTSVNEYSAGDLQDGYIVEAYDGTLQGRVSYPKFKTSAGTYISLKYGLWNSETGTYDKDHLKFLNVPVLKSHHATYGATSCVKHFMGVVTRELSTNSHNAIGKGILGALMGEIRPPDLNILDCIWINANPTSGPQTSYSGATRRDELLASLDPVALDIWAVKNILIPAFMANGFNPPWPYPSADPDDPNSAFRKYLDRSMNYLLAAGYSVTNDLTQIDVATWHPLGDLNCDGALDGADIDPFFLALSDPAAWQAAFPDCNILNGDVNRDGAVDAGDIDAFFALLGG